MSTALLPIVLLALAATPDVLVLRAPEGGIQPHAAVDAAGTLHLVFLRGDPNASDVFYSRRDAGAKAFTTAARVNSQPGSAVAVGNIRGPRIAMGRDGRIHVAWNGSSTAQPRGPLDPSLPANSPHNGTPLLYTRSTDAGATFEPQRNVMTRTFALDGGGAIAADHAGQVHVTWHGATTGDSTRESARRPWLATSTDDGATFAPERPAFDAPLGACACCSTTAFADPAGPLAIFYRIAKDDSQRGMFLLHSDDRAQKFTGTPIHEWELKACPMTSSAIAQSPKGLVLAWETKDQIYLALAATPAGRAPFAVAAPGSTPDRKYPALAVNPAGHVLLAWIEGMPWGKGGSAAWQIFDENLAPIPGASGAIENVPAWGIIAAATNPDGSFTVIY